MDESGLHDRLARIERRQRLMLALLVVPYLLGIAKLLGVWVASVLYTVLGLVAFAVVVFRRRRTRNAVGQ